MELRTLRYFVAVADAGSVSAASRAVHITQPSLSRQLRQLSRELGLSLFEPHDGRLALTSGGAQFLPVARDLIARAEAAQRTATAIALGRLPALTLCAPRVTITDIVAPFVATFGPEDPTPIVLEESGINPYDALGRGTDLVVGAVPPPRHLTSLRIARLPLFAYVPRGHALTGHDEVQVSQLATEPLLLLPPQTHARRTWDAAVAESHTAMGLVTEAPSSQVVQALAAAGRGVAIVSDNPRFDLVQLRITTPSGPLGLELHAAWSGQHHARARIADLARRLSAFVHARYEDSAAAEARVFA